MNNELLLKEIDSYSSYHSYSFMKIINHFIKTDFIFVEFENEKIYALFYEDRFEKFSEIYKPNIKIEFTDFKRQIIVFRTNVSNDTMLELLNKYSILSDKETESQEIKRNEANKPIKEDDGEIIKSNIVVKSLITVVLPTVLEEYKIVSKMSLDNCPNLEEDKRDKFARYIFFKLLNDFVIGKYALQIEPDYKLLQNITNI